MKTAAISLLALVLCAHATAQPHAASPAPVSSEAPVKDADEVRQILDDLVQCSFPELVGHSITLKTFDSDAFYFRSQPVVKTFLPNKKRAFLILVNERIFTLQPPRQAVVAILAHELCHSSHYLKSSVGTLLKELRQFVSKRAMARFERRTDLDAMSRGYAPGLIAYREWIYTTLSEKALATKRRSYLTPAEIRLVERVRDAHPDLLAEWAHKPPRTLLQFETSLAEHVADHPPTPDAKAGIEGRVQEGAVERDSR